MTNPLDRLKHHVTGAIERGEKTAIVEQAAPRMFGGSIHAALVHAATQYDTRQARGKRYNPYALAQYLGRITEVEADIKRGATPRAALLAAFNDRLLSCLLKAINEPDFTIEEKRAADCGWTYKPASR